RPSGVQQGAVEPSGFVLEDPQPRDLPRQPLGVLGRISRCYADQNEQPRADFASRSRTRSLYPLQDRPHVPRNSGRYVPRMGAPYPAPLPLRHPEETKPPLGRLLVERGLLTLEQLEQALIEKETSGGLLGEILVAHAWLTA